MTGGHLESPNWIGRRDEMSRSGSWHQIASLVIWNEPGNVLIIHINIWRHPVLLSENCYVFFGPIRYQQSLFSFPFYSSPEKDFSSKWFLSFFSSFFFPLMDQIFSKWRGQKMEKISCLLALGIILTALSCKWPNMICLSVIAICRQTLISPISTISQIRSMSTFILRAKMKLFQYVKHIMCIDS